MGTEGGVGWNWAAGGHLAVDWRGLVGGLKTEKYGEKESEKEEEKFN